jgi:hypothetical protein
MKELKGSKLDAKKRAEFEADVAAAWDTSSNWPSSYVIGRVLPERCQVMVPPRASRAIGAQSRFRVNFEVTQSHIAATYTAEKPDLSIFEIADAARTVLAFPSTTLRSKTGALMRPY